MVFNEWNRKKLIGVYRALPEDEQAAYRALAVMFVPISVTVLTPIKNCLPRRRSFYGWK
jgi:hypothetical protein